MTARLAFLVAVPLAAGAILLFHPTDPPPGAVVDSLAGVTGRWLAVHVGLLLALPLLALWLWAALAGIDDRAASVARFGAIPFAAFYSAFDAIVGIGTGVLVREALALPPEARAGAAELAEAWWRVPAPVWVFTTLGPISWLVAAGAAALAHHRAGSGWLVVAPLAAAAPLFAFGHPLILGPVAMLGLAVAGVALGSRQRTTTRVPDGVRR